MEEWTKDPLCRVNLSELRSRLAMGWEAEKAITSPSSYEPGKSSRFKGVSWHPKTNKWMARIRHETKAIHLGYFDDEVDAALAFDAKCRELRGADAETNFR